MNDVHRLPQYATPNDAEVPISEGASPSYVWSDARVLGFAPMDRTHEDFYRVAFELITCSPNCMLAALDAFETHAVEHFSQEEEWMRSTDFPPRDCHIDEHAAVLSSVRKVRAGVAAGTQNVDTVHD